MKRKNKGGVEEVISVDLVNIDSEYDIDVGRKVKKSEKEEGQTL